jgi:hypothetical protein
MSQPLSSKRLALLTLLAAQSAAITTPTIYSLVEGFKDTTDVSQTLGYMRATGLVSSAAGTGNGLLWSITDAGRAALEGKAAARKKARTSALSEPGIDPGHTGDAEGEEEEEDEELAAEAASVDFALWDSGVLQIQTGEDHFSIPASQVTRLRDYLNRHTPAQASSLLGGMLGVIGPFVAATVGIESAASQERSNKFAPWMNGQTAAPAAPPAPPAAAPAEASVSTVANCANAPAAAAPAPAPTEAIGLSGVELDGPGGIRIPGFLERTAGNGVSSTVHDFGGAPPMSRGEQFAETAARG